MINEFSGRYRWLSNFHTCSIVYDGVEYPSTENAYQAAKTIIKEERIQFEMITAGQSKRARQKVTLRGDWEAVKINIMKELTRLKYKKGILKKKLIATGKQEIVEGNYWGDTFWGVCKGKGDNRLGKILMKERKRLVKRMK